MAGTDGFLSYLLPVFVIVTKTTCTFLNIIKFQAKQVLISSTLQIFINGKMNN
jgi:hypothetical protein